LSPNNFNKNTKSNPLLLPSCVSTIVIFPNLVLLLRLPPLAAVLSSLTLFFDVALPLLHLTTPFSHPIVILNVTD
jgi:hypothetical protein